MAGLQDAGQRGVQNERRLMHDFSDPKLDKSYTICNLRLHAGSPSLPFHSVGPRQPRRSTVLLRLIAAGAAGHAVEWQTMQLLRRI